MNPRFPALAVAALVAVGCQKQPVPVAAQPTVNTLPPQDKIPAPPPVVAILEPYLVAFDPAPSVVSPPALGGRIVPSGPLTPLPEVAPLVPAPPTQTVPLPLKSTAPSRPTPVPKATIPPAVVRLFEDERARSVDDARRRLAAATTRAGQTAAEAKKQWGYVKEGFVAQRQAENADAAAKDAANEQADAQKTLDEAQQRQRDARRDLQAVYSAIGFTPVRLDRPLPAYRPLPFTYRLAVLGETAGAVTLENGTLGRSLPMAKGEGGAWIVRCADPSRVRVRVGGRASGVVVRALPPFATTVKGTI